MKVLVLPQTLHSGEIHSLDINSNGLVLTCGRDSKVLRWGSYEDLQRITNSRRLRPAESFRYHSSCVSIVRWNPADPSIFASGDILGNVFINRLSKEEKIFSQLDHYSTQLEDIVDKNHHLSKSILDSESSSIKDLDLDTSSTTDILSSSSDSNGAGTAKIADSELDNHSSSQNIVTKTPDLGIVDLTWSKDGRLLVWSTEDAKLHLYDTKKATYQELSSLRQNKITTIQRSLAFDPTGNYLISLSDDALIHLFQYQYDKKDNYNFRLINKIIKLVNNIAYNFNYKRISWSPDGEYVCVPTANKNLTSLVSIISRSQAWSNRISLVGHDLNCEVVKFNPNIFDSSKNEMKGGGKDVNEGKDDNNDGKNGDERGDVDVKDQTNGVEKTIKIDNTSQGIGREEILTTAVQEAQEAQEAQETQDITMEPPSKSAETNGNPSSKSTMDPKQQQESKKKEPSPFNIIATAGSDRTLAIWNTTKSAPLIVLRDLTSKPITDLCWNKSGDLLLLASFDGKLVSINFDQEDLGSIADKEVVERINALGLELIKSFDYKEPQEPGSRRTTQPIEILDQNDALDIDDKEPTAPKKGKLNDEDKKLNEPLKKKQKLVPVSSDITPQIVQVEKNEVVEITDDEDILQTAMTRSKALQNTSNKPTVSKSKPKSRETSAAKDKETPISNQKVTTKNGKRRVQPMLVSGNGTVTRKDETQPSSSSPVAPTGLNDVGPMEYQKASYSITEDEFKRSKRAQQDTNANGTGKRIKRQLEPVKFLEYNITNPNTTFAKIRLSFPKVRFSFSQKSAKFNDEDYTLHVTNGSGNEIKPSRISFYKKDQEIWNDFLPRYVQLATEGSEFWALSTIEGDILIYSTYSGRRLLPPLALGSPVSFLESHGNFLLAVTSIGELYVWDVAKKKIHLQSPTSLSSVLELSHKFKEDGISRSENITLCSVTSSGVPLLTLSNGFGYLYNKDFGAWQTVSESWWAFGSHYWDSVGEGLSSQSGSSSSLLKNNRTSIVNLLEQKTNEEILRKSRTGRGKYFNKISKNMIMKEGFENLENTISLSHLENRILCCELLKEEHDFKDYFVAYAKRISELSLKAKLYELCSGLLEKDEEMICGHNRRELLKEVVLACAKHRDVQRILLHFAKKIGLVVPEIEI